MTLTTAVAAAAKPAKEMLAPELPAPEFPAVGAAAPVSPVSRPVFALMVQLVDLALLLMAGLAATPAYEITLERTPRGALTVAAWIGAGAIVVAMQGRGGYTIKALATPGRSLLMLPVPLAIGWTATVVSLFLLHEGATPSRGWPFVFALVSLGVLVCHRLALWRVILHWRRQGRLVQRIAVVGVNDFSATFLERLAGQDGTFAVTGVYEDRQSRIPAHLRHIHVRGGVADLMAASRQERIDMVVVALPLVAADRINEVLSQLSSLVADVFLTTDVAGMRYVGAQFTAIGANPVVSVGERPIKDWQAVKKALFDRLVGGAVLVAALPVLAAAALLIKLDSPGPVLFRQPRVGFDNRMFSIFKFRTMHVGMTDLLADRQTTRDDPRITRVGRWLRKYSVDELPQLFNVLLGNMSLVGPRPHAPNTKAANKLFADVVGQYAVRHRVKPGITGWAQVNGWRGETRTEEQLRQRVRYDLDYIQDWSLGLDVKILVLTVLREIRSTTAF